jgi:hypothetical protein
MHTAQAEVGVYTESTMPSALGWKRSASEAVYPPPTLATMGGVLLTIFPHFFKEAIWKSKRS